ncbi:TRADD-N-associated membrane domain-containing protein [Oscillatoria salina]|uniref:TRADD-N-associated membrane domain-containing protein n=1 Tax=Oscillatoria salina TaxID=331517 RepID=UPI0013B788FD|nr:hypothetical protein [Oscillatoria salina]MBZ8179891.1 hypothetical protein [Oscillatoria salina IIICB1]NET87438.1 hypothetical protein [Kamptonema sp. SIO1D9]
MEPVSLTTLVGASLIFMVIILAFTAGLAGLLSIYEQKKLIKEKKEIKEEIGDYLGLLNSDTADILALMRRNVNELKEAYVISKQQVRNIFSTGLFVCCLGFIIFATGIIVSYSQGSSKTLIYSTVSGAIVEVVAGILFVVYGKSLEQLNSFHKSLQENHKLLTSLHVVDRVSDANKDAVYAYIVQNALGKNISADYSLITSSIKSNLDFNAPATRDRYSY